MSIAAVRRGKSPMAIRCVACLMPKVRERHRADIPRGWASRRKVRADNAEVFPAPSRPINANFRTRGLEVLTEVIDRSRVRGRYSYRNGFAYALFQGKNGEYIFRRV